MRRTASQEALEGIREEVARDYEAKRRFPRVLLGKIKQVEEAPVVQPALSALDFQLLNMQKLHNKLHHARMQKQAYLLLLSSELLPASEGFQASGATSQRGLTYLTTITALEKEEKTEATLTHIIDREKRRFKALALPINEIQEEIANMDRQIQEEKVKCQRIEAKKLVFEGNSMRLKSKLDSIHRRRTKEMKKMLKSFSDQQLFLTHFEKEEEAKRQLAGERAKAESLLALEYEMELKYGKK